MEEQLQKTLSDLETKEKNLVEAELKVLLLLSDASSAMFAAPPPTPPSRASSLTRLLLKTQRLQRDLRAEHKLGQKEAQETVKRLQLECDHRAALERDKVRLMEEERTRLLKQVPAHTSIARGKLERPSAFGCWGGQ